MTNSLRMDHFQKLITGEFPQTAYAKLLGMQLTKIGSGTATVEMDVNILQLANPLGALHGGAVTSLADHSMGIAYLSLLPDTEVFGTIELKINLLKMINTDCKLISHAAVLKNGKSIGVVEATVTMLDGTIVAKSISTCMRLPLSKN
ncbi:MAG: PaaI family thioesterase [Bacteriovoracaceae bacterium]|nr:PaaI family thioesterase [Bacteriovoracaceae bacterium]